MYGSIVLSASFLPSPTGWESALWKAPLQMFAFSHEPLADFSQPRRETRSSRQYRGISHAWEVAGIVGLALLLLASL